MDQLEIKDLQETEILLDDLLVFDRDSTDFFDAFNIKFWDFQKPLMPKSFLHMPFDILKLRDMDLIIRNEEWLRSYSDHLAHLILDLSLPLFNEKQTMDYNDFLYLYSIDMPSKIHFSHLQDSVLLERDAGSLAINFSGAVTGFCGSPIPLTESTTIVISTTIDGTKHNHDNTYSLFEHEHTISTITGLKQTIITGEDGIVVDTLDRDVHIALVETIDTVKILPDPSTLYPYITVQKLNNTFTIGNTYFNDAFKLEGKNGIMVNILNRKHTVLNSDAGSNVKISGMQGVFVKKVDNKTWEVSITPLPTPTPTRTSTGTPTKTRTPTPSTTQTLSRTPTPTPSNTTTRTAPVTPSTTRSVSASPLPPPPTPSRTPNPSASRSMNTNNGFSPGGFTPITPTPSNSRPPTVYNPPPGVSSAQANPTPTRSRAASISPTPSPSRSRAAASPTPSPSKISEYPKIFNISGGLSAAPNGVWTYPAQAFPGEAYFPKADGQQYRVVLNAPMVQYWMNPSGTVSNDDINANYPNFGPGWQCTNCTLVSVGNFECTVAKKTGVTATVVMAVTVTNRYDVAQNKPRQTFYKQWSVTF